MIGLAPWRMFGDEWLTTRRAAKLFFIASLFLAAVTVQMVGWIDPVHMPAWERILWVTLGMAGTAGGFLLWYGMRRYWLRLDDSRASAKRIWFPVVLFGLWWGSCLYYYCVYLPQVLRKWKAES